MKKEKWENHFGHRYRVIHNMIDKYFEKRLWGSEITLTRVQCATLHYLYDHRTQDVFQKDIENVFSITGATATNILKGMERQSLIKRVPMEEDARLKKIVLLDKGIACHWRALDNMNHMEETLSAGMSEQEKEQLRRLLDHVISNLEGLQELQDEKIEKKDKK